MALTENLNNKVPKSPSAIVLELSILSEILNESARITTSEDSKRSIRDLVHVPTGGADDGSKAEKRSWTGKVKFIISCVGYSVGLGNVWRFPYLCYIHGGGSFLISYIVMLVLVGLPLFLLEVTLGQYTGKGPIAVFANMCPIFGGLGPAMLSVTFLVLIYYNLLLAWSLFYIFASFTKHLPWEKCSYKWSSPDCYTSKQAFHCSVRNMTFWNSSCYDSTKLCKLQDINSLYSNATQCWNGSSTEVTHKLSAAEDYFMNQVLGISDSIEHMGYMRWQLVLCLFFAWFLVFVCLIRGSYTSGKVVYFTAMFPCAILLILSLKSLTLEGAQDGILFYITPHLINLFNPQIWGDAAIHVIFSLGPIFGGLVSLSSYNDFHNNCLRDSVVVVLCDAITSLFAGFVIFSVVGCMSRELDIPIDSVIHSGPVMAFVAYPEAISRLSVSPLWSFLFFSMLLTLGLDSQYTAVESIRTSIEDIWPTLTLRKTELLILICSCCFIIGLPMTCKAGVYIFTLFDQYAVNWSVLIIGVLECVVTCWIYGNVKGDNKLKVHLEEMIGSKSSSYWLVCWKVVTPAILTFILVSRWLTHCRVHYGDYEFPTFVDVVGWFLSLVTVSCVPIWALYLATSTRKLNQPLHMLLEPTNSWGSSVDV